MANVVYETDNPYTGGEPLVCCDLGEDKGRFPPSQALRLGVWATWGDDTRSRNSVSRPLAFTPYCQPGRVNLFRTG